MLRQPLANQLCERPDSGREIPLLGVNQPDGAHLIDTVLEDGYQPLATDVLRGGELGEDRDSEAAQGRRMCKRETVETQPPARPNRNATSNPLLDQVDAATSQHHLDLDLRPAVGKLHHEAAEKGLTEDGVGRHPQGTFRRLVIGRDVSCDKRRGAARKPVTAMCATSPTTIAARAYAA
jgi:hypothetical protein